ncbi:MAG: hypothetical protein CMO77_06880 [Verrucomicrobiales bacterium]|nr:hypothetical protein [Verrucomicrobiales bacterium]|tara:strand:+ start:274 stop:795 length:522 start_codon:yes stop_codon:yes gene_type:complete
MKRTILLLVLGLSFAISGITQDNSKEAEDFYKFYSYFQAKWQVEQVTDGKKENIELNCYGSAGGCNIAIGKGANSEWSAIWGYDPKTQQWTGTGQMKDGSRFVMAISRPPAEKFKAGMTFAFTGTIWHADGKIHYVTRKFTCVDADSWHSSTIGTDQDGNAIPKVITTAKRTK